jgi:hypothetical protein
MGRSGSTKMLMGVIIVAILAFLLSGIFSLSMWRHGIGCAESLAPPRIYTEQELDSMRGNPIRTADWSWFRTSAGQSIDYFRHPFLKHLTAGWPLTLIEITSTAEGCISPWVTHTAWYLGGWLVDIVVSAGLGALLVWLLRLGFGFLRQQRR